VAVIGSGPPGLAAAQQLNRAGHSVTVFEKADRIGGLLRYGIPDFKLGRTPSDRRLAPDGAGRCRVQTGRSRGSDVEGDDLRKEFDRAAVGGWCRESAGPECAGRNLKGIHFAMDPSATEPAGGGRPRAGQIRPPQARGDYRGGDTGADCLGTAHRQKAHSVHQFEIMPEPPLERSRADTVAALALQLRIESSHEEGACAKWAAATTHFSGDEQGNVKQLHARPRGAPPALNGSPYRVRSGMLTWSLLAMGFTGPVRLACSNSLIPDWMRAATSPRTKTT